MIAYYNVEGKKTRVLGGTINLEDAVLFDTYIENAKILITLDKWYIKGVYNKVESKSVVKIFDKLQDRDFSVGYPINHKKVGQQRYLQYLEVESLLEMLHDYIKCADDKKKRLFEKRVFNKIYLG
jgi:hypothetical protein